MISRLLEQLENDKNTVLYRNEIKLLILAIIPFFGTGAHS